MIVERWSGKRRIRLFPMMARALIALIVWALGRASGRRYG